jgi:IS30 family transposase
VRKVVASKLILDWSPEQISGWLKIQYPADESMRVSHETIYRSLFIQARGVLKKERIGHLRSKRRIRRSQHARIFKDSRGQIVDAISIRERPAEIEDRAVPGHWEGDLIGGTKNSHIATLVAYPRKTARAPLIGEEKLFHSFQEKDAADEEPGKQNRPWRIGVEQFPEEIHGDPVPRCNRTGS